jgi:hypothetical protein
MALTSIWILVFAFVASSCSTAEKKPSAKPAIVVKTTSKPTVSEPPQPNYPSPEQIEEDEDETPTVDPAAALELSGDWVWLGNLTPTETFKVDKPNRYRLSIKPNGWFEVHADCVKGEGLYEASKDRIALALVQKEGSGCNLSHHQLFLDSLESAGGFRLVGEQLRFRIKREKREMVLYRPKP